MHAEHSAILILAASVTRLRFLRETLQGFLHCTIDTTTHAEYAFELAIKKTHHLYVFEMEAAVIPGPVLYGLLRKVHDAAATGPKQLPPVIFLAEESTLHSAPAIELGRQPGVRAVLKNPPAIQKLRSIV